MRFLLVGLIGVGIGVLAVASDLPPLSTPSTTDTPLPNGKPVSQPLQQTAPPAEIVPVDAAPVRQVDDPPALPAPPPSLTPSGALPKSWQRAGVIQWWRKGQTLPPLLTASNSGTPALGRPGTIVLFGGERVSQPDTTGGRFTFGWSSDEAHKFGWEVDYLFLGTQTTADGIGARANTGWSVGRPIINPATLAEDVVPIAGVSRAGIFESSLSTRVTGWEVNGLANLIEGEHFRLHALAGYRYFQSNEGLRLTHTTAEIPDATIQVMPTPLLRTEAVDQIDAHTRFHGGQIGLRSELVYGRFSLELDTKVALGRTTEVAKISGVTSLLQDGMAPIVFTGGVLGQPSNTGRFVHNAFAVLPEGSARLSFQYTRHARLFVGYNVIYLSRVVRVGDQIDRVVDMNQRFSPSAMLFGPAFDRPRATLDASDLWVQGVTLGLEWKY